ncbi:MAG: alpha/beta hydrolase [Verrucomicrobiota bacterium]
MKRLLLLTLLLVVAVQSPAAERREIKLWPQGMPEPVVPAEPLEAVVKGPDGIARRSNVSQPRLFVHEPPAGVKRSGAGVIVVPGGGFGRLADEHEGSDACEWLAKNGVVAFQLAYRTPTNKHTEPNAGPVQDTQKAVMEVRRLAAELGIDAKKIGVLGFSAGGQVALIAATNEPKFSGASGSIKPDFLLLIYPYQIYDKTSKALRSEIKLEAILPPTFIAQAGDDTGSLPQGSTLLYLDLINRKIPAEIHIYEKGGHGFGMRPRAGATGPTDWPVRATDWLRLRGYVVASMH